MGKISVKFLVRGAAVAALYATLTVALGMWSYGPVQFRVSEALTVLPFLMPEAVPGLFVGCIIANLFSTNILVVDVVVGSSATLIAAWCTWQIGRKVKSRRLGMLLAPLPPVALNAVMIGGMLTFLSAGGFSAGLFFGLMLQIGLSEFLVCYLLGFPLLHIIGRTPAGRNSGAG